MIPSVSPEADRELSDSSIFYAREANAEVGLAFILEYERAPAAGFRPRGERVRGRAAWLKRRGAGGYNWIHREARRYEMSSMLVDLKEKASRLSDAERAELALSLIESLDGPADPEVEEAWRLEVEHRIAQIERGEVQLIPGDEVFARLRHRLG